MPALPQILITQIPRRFHIIFCAFSVSYVSVNSKPDHLPPPPPGRPPGIRTF